MAQNNRKKGAAAPAKQSKPKAPSQAKAAVTALVDPEFADEIKTAAARCVPPMSVSALLDFILTRQLRGRVQETYNELVTAERQQGASAATG